MSYFTLTPDQGHLTGRKTLSAAAKAKAEAWATMRIDEAFFAWDRTLWTGATLPQQIADAAELLATGKYLEIEYATGNPVVDPNSLSVRLTRAGEEAIVRILDAGGPIDPSYPTTILRPWCVKPAGRVVRIVRG